MVAVCLCLRQDCVGFITQAMSPIQHSCTKAHFHTQNASASGQTDSLPGTPSNVAGCSSSVKHTEQLGQHRVAGEPPTSCAQCHPLVPHHARSLAAHAQPLLQNTAQLYCFRRPCLHQCQAMPTQGLRKCSTTLAHSMHS